MENKPEMSVVVQDAMLDAAVNVINIMQYLKTRGILLIHSNHNSPEQSTIYLENAKFKELFPMVEHDADGWFPVVKYDGYNVRAAYPESVTEEDG